VEGRTHAERRRARRNALYWFLLAAAIIAGAALLFTFDRTPKVPDAPSLEPLSLVPPGPAFVLTLDITALRANPAAEAFLGAELERLDAGTGGPAWGECVPKLNRDVARVAVAGTSPASFAVIASGRFQKGAALACAQASVGNGAAIRTTIGSFETLRDPKKKGELAARDGLLVVSEGDYFRAVLDRAEARREAPAAPDERDRLHAELRRTVGQGAPVIATVVLPRGWLASSLGDPEAERSPLAAIRTLALRANVTNAAELAGTIACENEPDATRLEHFFATLRADLGAERLEGALSLLTALKVVRRGALLEFSGRLSPDDLTRLAPRSAPSARP
jgi:hypothetical protein